MKSFTMLTTVLILACCAKYCEMLPIQGSPTATDHLDNEEFLISNGITQEEIEEFHRANGYDIPHEEEESQGRSLGTFVGKLKFWNWSSFNNFRQWIYERRTRTTTLAPIPVYIVNNPHDPYYRPYKRFD